MRPKVVGLIAAAILIGALTPAIFVLAHDGNTSADYIHACVRPDGWGLRIRDAASGNCSGAKVPLHWSIEGSGSGGTGPTGATGPTGPSGMSGSASFQVGTDQGTSSTTYTDLATVGPSVSAIVPASGQMMVVLTAMIRPPAAAAGYMSFATEGPGADLAPSDFLALVVETGATETVGVQASGTFVADGLAAGETITFTAKYKSTASDTTQFSFRQILVIPLP